MYMEHTERSRHTFKKAGRHTIRQTDRQCICMRVCPPQGSSVCVRVNYHSISPQIAPSTEGLFNRRVIRDNLSSDSQRGYTVKRQYRCARKREAMLNSGGHRTVLHLVFDYTQESRTEYQNGYFLRKYIYVCDV